MGGASSRTTAPLSQNEPVEVPLEVSQHIQLAGVPGVDPEHAGGIIHLAWECFRVPKEELENIAG